MKNNYLIKICGVRTPDIAEFAIKAGANFIGLIFHDASPRAVTIEQARVIAKITRQLGGVPVAVFVKQNANQIEEICLATEIRTIQLHGELPRAQHHLLASDYQRIYVQHLTQEGNLVNEIGMPALDPQRDIILLDHLQSGKGMKLPFPGHVKDKFSPFRWLLAGGLTPLNVAETMMEWQPNGVDVATGVESTPGIKDIALIQTFITAVRGTQHGA